MANPGHNNCTDEHCQIRTLLEQQQKRIFKLEKLQKELKKNDSLLEDAVNDLFDKVEEGPDPKQEKLDMDFLFGGTSTENQEAKIKAYGESHRWSKKKIAQVTKQAKQFFEKDTAEPGLSFFLKSSDDERQQMCDTITELKSTSVVPPYKCRILSSAMDNYTKKQALYKASQLEQCDPGSGDYFKIKGWLDTLLSIPWGRHNELNLGNTPVSKYLIDSRMAMDKVIYGQNETKDTIIQIISKMITNPKKCGNVFAIHGPPGVGKTTIVKSGMCQALGFPFAFISLGGATDSSYLDGHSYTYEGSTPGRIVDILCKVQCMNPIFYFDELDKISTSKKGEEIANLLIHLTDPSQNNLFQDKYMGNIHMDLSKSIFVFSFNDIQKVNPVLLDRMELIYVKGFTAEEKLAITRNYLVPELCDTYGLTGETAVAFSDENLGAIITMGSASNSEQGVRQIKRRLEKVCAQLNIVKLTKDVEAEGPIHSILDKLPELKKISWPLTLTNDMIEKLLKTNHSPDTDPPVGMYC